MEFHPDPAEEEEEMRPLHLVLRNVPRKGGGGSGGGKEDREGATGSLCLHLVALTSCFLGDQRWARRGWQHVQPSPAQKRE